MMCPKKKNRGSLFIICFVLSILLIFACGDNDQNPDSKLYFGLKPPGMTPELFAPGIVCTEKNEGYMTFLEDGRVLIFDHWSRDEPDANPYYVAFMKDGDWTAPVPAEFEMNSYEPNLDIHPGPDLFCFAANRSLDGKSPSETGWDLWITRWTGSGFTGVRRLNDKINSPHWDAWPSLAPNGTLYYMSRRPDGFGRMDIYRTEFRDGDFIPAVNIGKPVNTEYSEADPAIAPDESYMVFCSQRPNGFGNLDLYVTFKKADGNWSSPINMGERFNSSASDEKPYISPDGKYFFFSNDKAGQIDIYWVDAGIIEKMRPGQ